MRGRENFSEMRTFLGIILLLSIINFSYSCSCFNSTKCSFGKISVPEGLKYSLKTIECFNDEHIVLDWMTIKLVEPKNLFRIEFRNTVSDTLEVKNFEYPYEVNCFDLGSIEMSSFGKISYRKMIINVKCGRVSNLGVLNCDFNHNITSTCENKIEISDGLSEEIYVLVIVCSFVIIVMIMGVYKRRTRKLPARRFGGEINYRAVL